ncbi:2OG-Fe(II) oxygenase [Salinispirillum sp. LH 10-3-1]|uniref:2OG-Fe(II) oxygenase n=1 Tax=Salinispirillum sp. LH 10-3-1 TaxID=2952525 RepID=A0AB38YF40_9GAMM
MALASIFDRRPPDDSLETIAYDVERQGYAVMPDFITAVEVDALLQVFHGLRQHEDALQPAGIGRGDDYQTNNFVRQDWIHWIDGTTAPTQLFLDRMRDLQVTLNRRLFMGLFDYEAHFALYPEGAFYKKHIDAFQGHSNRRLSTVLYLNYDWQPTDGGELRCYDPDEPNQVLFDLPPAAGTLVVFESERFWHEVLPAKRRRFSVAGWFRINTSTSSRVDPPHWY